MPYIIDATNLEKRHSPGNIKSKKDSDVMVAAIMERIDEYSSDFVVNLVLDCFLFRNSLIEILKLIIVAMR